MAVYGLQLNQDEGRIKVGTSTNARIRIHAQTKEAVLFIVDGDKATEAVCHALLAPYRVRWTEEFVVPDAILRALRGLGDFSGIPHGKRPVPVPGLDF